MGAGASQLAKVSRAFGSWVFLSFLTWPCLIIITNPTGATNIVIITAAATTTTIIIIITIIITIISIIIIHHHQPVAAPNSQNSNNMIRCGHARKKLHGSFLA
jgi:hypothetical protein